MSEERRLYVVCVMIHNSDHEATVEAGCSLAVSGEEAIGKYVTLLRGHDPGLAVVSVSAGEVPIRLIERTAWEYGLLPEEAHAENLRLREALATAETEARRYAKAYPEASDARYALNTLADRIAGLANSEDDKGRSG